MRGGVLREERAGEGRDAFGLPQAVQRFPPKEKQTNSEPSESWAKPTAISEGQGISKH